MDSKWTNKNVNNAKNYHYQDYKMEIFTLRTKEVTTISTERFFYETGHYWHMKIMECFK